MVVMPDILTCRLFSKARDRPYNKNMKYSKAKILAAFFFFFLGYIGNNLVDIVKREGPTTIEGVERYPVNPDDFDHRKMIEAMNQSRSQDSAAVPVQAASSMGDISQREDEKFIYYEIPINQSADTDYELKIEVKRGMILITEMLKDKVNPINETNAERMFTIDPELDTASAEVLNEKNRVLIKIPKKRI